jgi:sulfur carrier protein ThiS
VRCPEIGPLLARGVAVAVDGEIYRDAWFHPVRSDSEIYILPKMAGG